MEAKKGSPLPYPLRKAWYSGYMMLALKCLLGFVLPISPFNAQSIALGWGLERSKLMYANHSEIKSDLF